MFRAIASVAVAFFVPLVSGTARTGSFSVQPYTANPIMEFSYDFFGEGIEYDSKRDRVLLGTLSSGGPGVAGKIFSVPYANPAVSGRVIYNKEDMKIIFNNTDGAVIGIAGIQMDPVNPDIVWATTSTFPPTTTSSCGVISVDISTGLIVKSYDFSNLRSTDTNRCLTNDIIFDNSDNMYVTDFFGYQIFKVTGASTCVNPASCVSVSSDDTSYLCVESASNPCPPYASGESQPFYSLNGPNGIEFIDEKLIVAVSPTRMVSVNLANGNLSVISQLPVDGVQGCDGIKFNSDGSELYIAGFGTTGSVIVATSVDGWESMTINTAYSASCTNDGTTAVAIASNKDVLVFCSNNFGIAPYNVSVLAGIVGDSLSGKSNNLMALSSTISGSNFRGEGIDFFKGGNNLVFGSTTNGSNPSAGSINGVSPSVSGARLTSSDVITYFPGSLQEFSSVGLEMNSFDSTGCTVYTAIGSAEFGTAGGVSFSNLCDTSLSPSFVSTETVRDSNSGQLINDLVAVSANTIYATDSFANNIILLKNPSTSSELPSVFYENICNFPNGIESVGNYLLVGCADGIYRLDTRSKQTLKVNDASNFVAAIDGLKFDSEKEVLYGVVNNRLGGHPDDATNFQVAISSNDNWESLDLLYVFDVGCSNKYPSTTALNGNSIFTVCLGVDSSPLEIRYLTDVNNKVTGGNTVYPQTDSTSSDGDDDEEWSTEKKLTIAVLVLALFCGVLIILVAAGAKSMRNMHIARHPSSWRENGLNLIDKNSMRSDA